MSRRYWNVASILFNIIETIIIIFCAYKYEIGLKSTLIVFFCFQISKGLFKKQKHYKKWQDCLIWSTILVLSMFLVSKTDAIVGGLSAIFGAYIISTKADIKDMYMWSGKASKYDPLRDFVGISPNNPIILDYENYWRVNYPLRYEIFRYFYRERKSYEEIRNIKDYDENNVIKNECKSIYEQLEKPLNLPPLKN